MENFVYGGQLVPLMGENSYDGGNPGLNYRFWNEQADSGYASDSDAEILEEAAFLNLFPCRKHCKETVGKGPNFRNCLRECRGKGPKKSVIAAKEAETQSQLASALSKMSSEPTDTGASSGGGSKTIIWVIVSVVALLIIGLLIFFLMRKKAAADGIGM